MSGGFGGVGNAFGNLVGQLPSNMQQYIGGMRPAGVKIQNDLQQYAPPPWQRPSYPQMPTAMFAPPPNMQQPGFMNAYGGLGRYSSLAQDLAAGSRGISGFGGGGFTYSPAGNPWAGRPFMGMPPSPTAPSGPPAHYIPADFRSIASLGGFSPLGNMATFGRTNGQPPAFQRF